MTDLASAIHDNHSRFVGEALALPGAASEPAAAAPQVLSPGKSPLGPAARASAAGIELSVWGDLHAVGSEWRDFASRAEYTAFQAFDWLATWQCHIGARQGVIPAVVLGRDADGSLLFILPLAIAARGPIRRLTWLGWDLSDYNAPILAKDFSRHMDAARFLRLWREIIAVLCKDPRLSFHFIDLQKMPQTIGAQENPLTRLPVTPNPSGAYSTELGREWEAFYASKRSSTTRRRDRTKLKRLSGYGKVRFLDPQDPKEIEHTLNTLVEQKTRSFARMGIPNLFARPGCREFFLAIATNPELRDLVHVSRLEIGSTIAAANFGVTLRGCYYHVLSSYGDGEWSHFGPGAAHLRELLRRAIERGLHRFDFTMGDEAYKREWCGTKTTLYDHCAAVTARGWPIVAICLASRRTKRFIKQTPLLWRAFSRARVLAGSLWGIRRH